MQTYENGLQNIAKLYLKVVESGKEFFVRTSVGHRLYVLDHGFEHAQDVPTGARMINYNQQVVEVLAVELEPDPELVYNFEVEEAHTYFVGDDAECCVLGHNEDCGIRKPANCGSDIDAVNKALSQGEGKLNVYNSFLDNRHLKNKLRAAEDLHDIKEKVAEEVVVNAAGWGVGKIFLAVGGGVKGAWYGLKGLWKKTPKMSTHFPINPKNFTPEGLVRKEYKNGEIIKWVDPKTNKAKFEWNLDTNGGHYHMTPDGKHRVPHPDTNDTHIPPGTIIPK